MNAKSFGSVDEIQLYILEKFFSEGEIITTRNLKTKEICNVNFCLLDPRNRKTNIPDRKWNYPLALGEFSWHIKGSNEVDFISYYANQWKEFSDDGKFIRESCYGHKIFSKDIQNESQWTKLIKLLKQDNFSRRAVINLYDSNNGLDYLAKDISCVCTVQFLIRNNKLDAIVNMRSNDIIWGLPYDIFLFTMLQELLALELGFELGRYFHNVGSMHIYERHFDMAKKMINSENFDSIPMSVMQHSTSLDIFLNFEKKIRKEDIGENDIIKLSIDNYWKELLIILLDYKRKKQK